MALFIFMCFITGFNVIMNAVNHNYPALLGWLCAYFGFFEVDGMEGFVTTSQIDEMFPDLVCRIVGETE